jgi:hypothetical protein
MTRRGLTWLVSAAIALAATATAQAQESSGHAHAAEPRISFGGEIALTGTPVEDTGFFNNTDYDVNAMRLVRLRMSAEWRATRSLSFVGDLRSENAAHVLTPSAYLRWAPVRSVVIQAGRIPPVFGAFTRRPYGRDALTLGEPLGYQYLTSLRPDALPNTIDDVLRMRGRGWQPSFPVGSAGIRGGVPLVSVSTWDTGVEGTWTSTRIDLSASVTQGSMAVPTVRDRNDGVTTSGRVVVRAPAGVTLGASVAHGEWLDNAVLDLTPARRESASAQSVIGADAEFGNGPLLVRAEFLRAAFDVPLVTAGGGAHLESGSAFVEGRYRFQPRMQLGVRAEQITFSKVRGSNGVRAAWDAPVQRVEVMFGFRATRHLDVRLGWQYNWRDGTRVPRLGLPVAGVFFWF